MKKLLISLLVLLLGISAAAAERPVYYIRGGNADRVHLRTRPSAEAESLGLYFTGTDVIVIDCDDEWAWVMIGDAEGYVMKEYLTGDTPAQLGPWYFVDNPDSTWVNLRMSPSMDGMIALCPENGTMVHILGETADGWSYVECEGVKGYMRTGMLSPMEDAASALRTTIVGETPEGDYILRYIAPNGQSIYFTAKEKEPPVTFRDVNFDGATDIVVYKSMGASNFYTDFFVFVPETGEYVRADHPGGGYGICNFQLHPEQKIVRSHADNGAAGAEHEICLYRWEGATLRLLRRAVSEPLTESEFLPDRWTTTTWTDILRISIWDYQDDQYDGKLIWTQTITLEDSENRDIFAAEEVELWQGIR